MATGDSTEIVKVLFEFKDQSGGAAQTAAENINKVISALKTLGEIKPPPSFTKAFNQIAAGSEKAAAGLNELKTVVSRGTLSTNLTNLGGSAERAGDGLQKLSSVLKPVGSAATKAAGGLEALGSAVSSGGLVKSLDALVVKAKEVREVLAGIGSEGLNDARVAEGAGRIRKELNEVVAIGNAARTALSSIGQGLAATKGIGAALTGQLDKEALKQLETLFIGGGGVDAAVKKTSQSVGRLQMQIGALNKEQAAGHMTAERSIALTSERESASRRLAQMMERVNELEVAGGNAKTLGSLRNQLRGLSTTNLEYLQSLRASNAAAERQAATHSAMEAKLGGFEALMRQTVSGVNQYATAIQNAGTNTEQIDAHLTDARSHLRRLHSALIELRGDLGATDFSSPGLKELGARYTTLTNAAQAFVDSQTRVATAQKTANENLKSQQSVLRKTTQDFRSLSDVLSTIDPRKMSFVGQSEAEKAQALTSASRGLKRALVDVDNAMRNLSGVRLGAQSAEVEKQLQQYGRLRAELLRASEAANVMKDRTTRIADAQSSLNTFAGALARATEEFNRINTSARGLESSTSGTSKLLTQSGNAANELQSALAGLKAALHGIDWNESGIAGVRAQYESLVNRAEDLIRVQETVQRVRRKNNESLVRQEAVLKESTKTFSKLSDQMALLRPQTEGFIRSQDPSNVKNLLSHYKEYSKALREIDTQLRALREAPAGLRTPDIKNQIAQYEALRKSIVGISESANNTATTLQDVGKTNKSIEQHGKSVRTLINAYRSLAANTKKAFAESNSGRQKTALSNLYTSANRLSTSLSVAATGMRQLVSELERAGKGGDPLAQRLRAYASGLESMARTTDSKVAAIRAKLDELGAKSSGGLDKNAKSAEDLAAHFKYLTETAGSLEKALVSATSRGLRTVEVQGMIKQLSGLKSALESVANQSLKLAGSFGDAQLAKDLKSQASKAAQHAARLGNTLEQLKQQMRDVGQHGGIFEQLGLKSSVGALAEEGAVIYKQMGKFFSFLRGGSQGAAGDLSQVEKAVMDLEKSMVRFRSGVVTWSIGLLMLGTAISAPFVSAIREFAKFEDTMAIVKGVTDSTIMDFNNLTETAKVMGATTRFTGTQAAEGLRFLGMAGFEANEAIKALPTTLRLAQAAAMDLGRAADVVTNIMTAFEIPINELSYASDVLSKATTTSNSTLQNLGFSFTYVGSLARGLGVSFEDVTGALAKMHNAGFKGCSDYKTEVLTKEGFKLFKDVEPDDQIMTMNLETGRMEWQHHQGTVEYDINEPLFYVNTKSLNMAVTDNHRLPIETRAGRRKIVEAKDFKEGRFFRTGIWKGERKEHFTLPGIAQNRGNRIELLDSVQIPMDDWVEFLGWYFSEGSLNQNKGDYKTYIYQTENGEKYESLVGLLDRLPFHYGRSGVSFRIYSEQLYTELSKYGKGFGDKRLPEYLKELPPEQLRVFYESFRKGDGDSQGNLYTSNDGLRDDLYEVVLKSGFAPQYKVAIQEGEQRRIGDRVVTATQEGYIINVSQHHAYPYVSLSEQFRREQSGKPRTNRIWWERYKGKVYSIRVPNTIVYVRREGVGHFTGNTLAGTALRGMLDALFNPTKDEARVMQELGDRMGVVGFRLKDAEGNFVGFIEMIRQLEQAGFNSEEALRLFGQRAGPGVAALLRTGADEMESYMDALHSAAGTTEQLSNEMESTLAGRFLILRSAVTGLGKDLAESLEGGLRTVADGISTFIEKVLELRKALGPITTILDYVAAAFAGLTAVVGVGAFAWALMLVPALQFVEFLRTLVVAAAAGGIQVLGLNEKLKLLARTQNLDAAAKQLATNLTWGEIEAIRAYNATLARSIALQKVAQATKFTAFSFNKSPGAGVFSAGPVNREYLGTAVDAAISGVELPARRAAEEVGESVGEAGGRAAGRAWGARMAETVKEAPGKLKDSLKSVFGALEILVVLLAGAIWSRVVVAWGAATVVFGKVAGSATALGKVFSKLAFILRPVFNLLFMLFALVKAHPIVGFAIILTTALVTLNRSTTKINAELEKQKGLLKAATTDAKHYARAIESVKDEAEALQVDDNYYVNMRSLRNRALESAQQMLESLEKVSDGMEFRVKYKVDYDTGEFTDEIQSLTAHVEDSSASFTIFDDKVFETGTRLDDLTTLIRKAKESTKEFLSSPANFDDPAKVEAWRKELDLLYKVADSGSAKRVLDEVKLGIDSLASGTTRDAGESLGYLRSRLQEYFSTLSAQAESATTDILKVTKALSELEELKERKLSAQQTANLLLDTGATGRLVERYRILTAYNKGLIDLEEQTKSLHELNARAPLWEDAFGGFGRAFEDADYQSRRLVELEQQRRQEIQTILEVSNYAKLSAGERVAFEKELTEALVKRYDTAFKFEASARAKAEETIELLREEAKEVERIAQIAKSEDLGEWMGLVNRVLHDNIKNLEDLRKEMESAHKEAKELFEDMFDVNEDRLDQRLGLLEDELEREIAAVERAAKERALVEDNIAIHNPTTSGLREVRNIIAAEKKKLEVTRDSVRDRTRLVREFVDQQMSVMAQGNVNLYDLEKDRFDRAKELLDEEIEVNRDTVNALLAQRQSLHNTIKTLSQQELAFEERLYKLRNKFEDRNFSEVGKRRNAQRRLEERMSKARLHLLRGENDEAKRIAEEGLQYVESQIESTPLWDTRNLRFLKDVMNDAEGIWSAANSKMKTEAQTQFDQISTIIEGLDSSFASLERTLQRLAEVMETAFSRKQDSLGVFRDEVTKSTNTVDLLTERLRLLGAAGKGEGRAEKSLSRMRELLQELTDSFGNAGTLTADQMAEAKSKMLELNREIASTGDLINNSLGVDIRRLDIEGVFAEGANAVVAMKGELDNLRTKLDEVDEVKLNIGLPSGVEGAREQIESIVQLTSRLPELESQLRNIEKLRSEISSKKVLYGGDVKPVEDLIASVRVFRQELLKVSGVDILEGAELVPSGFVDGQATYSVESVNKALSALESQYSKVAAGVARANQVYKAQQGDLVGLTERGRQAMDQMGRTGDVIRKVDDSLEQQRGMERQVKSWRQAEGTAQTTGRTIKKIGDLIVEVRNIDPTDIDKLEEARKKYRDLMDGVNAMKGAVAALVHEGSLDEEVYNQLIEATQHLGKMLGEEYADQLQRAVKADEDAKENLGQSLKAETMRNLEQAGAALHRVEVSASALADVKLGGLDPVIRDVAVAFREYIRLFDEAKQATQEGLGEVAVQNDNALARIKEVLAKYKDIKRQIEQSPIQVQTTTGRMGGGIVQTRQFGGPIMGLASGGDWRERFKRQAWSKVPGAGRGDRVPAMLEPGEFVLRLDAVRRLGVPFLNFLNSGALQLKQAGGVIAGLPRKISGMASSMPNPRAVLGFAAGGAIPAIADAGGGKDVIDIRLTVPGSPHTFNLQSPRGQVGDLVKALKNLERGIPG